MKIRLMVAPLLLSVSSLALAGGFDGPSVQVGVGVSAAHTKLEQYSPDGTVGDSNTFGSLALGYSQSFGAFNLGGSVFSMMGSQNSGSLRSFAEDTGGVWNDRFKLKNIWGISIEPGFNVNDSTLVYAKLSYVKATGHNDYYYGADDFGGASSKHSGTGFGAGIKVKLTPNLYGFVEFEKVNFNTKTYYSDVPETYKPNLTKGSVGLGYKF